jgi:hypothetical protein
LIEFKALYNFTRVRGKQAMTALALVQQLIASKKITAESIQATITQIALEIQKTEAQKTKEEAEKQARLFVYSYSHKKDNFDESSDEISLMSTVLEQQKKMLTTGQTHDSALMKSLLFDILYWQRVEGEKSKIKSLTPEDLHMAVAIINGPDGKMTVNILEDQSGNSLLYNVVAARNEEAAIYLIGLVANLNIQGKTKNTALHQAAYQPNPTLCRILVERGADLTLLNDKNESPINNARSDEALKAILQALVKRVVTQMAAGKDIYVNDSGKSITLVDSSGDKTELAEVLTPHKQWSNSKILATPKYPP